MSLTADNVSWAIQDLESVPSPTLRAARSKCACVEQRLTELAGYQRRQQRERYAILAALTHGDPVGADLDEDRRTRVDSATGERERARMIALQLSRQLGSGAPGSEA